MIYYVRHFRPESNEKQMPTKRINEKEASSDDCDSDDES